MFGRILWAWWNCSSIEPKWMWVPCSIPTGTQSQNWLGVTRDPIPNLVPKKVPPQVGTTHSQWVLPRNCKHIFNCHFEFFHSHPNMLVRYNIISFLEVYEATIWTLAFPTTFLHYYSKGARWLVLLHIQICHQQANHNGFIFVYMIYILTFM